MAGGELLELFSQRVTVCERRDGVGACSECALRLGRVRPQDESELVKASIERSKQIIDISGESREKMMQKKAQQ